MNALDIISLVVTAVGVGSFATIFTILYRGYANSAVAELDSGSCDVDLIYETIRLNIKNSKLYKRILKRIKQVFIWILVVLLILFLLFSVYSKIVNGVAMVNGRGFIAVASGSMSMKHEENPYLANIDNQFNTYDIIVLEKVESEDELKLYDVIAYVNDEGENIIHRIVGFQQTASGVRYITRGDSNNADDIYRPSIDNVLGKYTGARTPYVGAFLMFLQSYSGIVTVAAVIYCLIMIDSVNQKIFDAREDRILFLQELIDFKTDTVQDENINSTFLETVRFKDHIYVFDDDGLVSKTKISEESDTRENIDVSVVPQEASADDRDGE